MTQYAIMQSIRTSWTVPDYLSVTTVTMINVKTSAQNTPYSTLRQMPLPVEFMPNNYLHVNIHLTIYFNKSLKAIRSMAVHSTTRGPTSQQPLLLAFPFCGLSHLYWPGSWLARSQLQRAVIGWVRSPVTGHFCTSLPQARLSALSHDRQSLWSRVAFVFPGLVSRPSWGALLHWPRLLDCCCCSHWDRRHFV